MFQKLHYRLTGLCALITMGILLVFTALYLYIAENTLTENHRLSFQHDFDTLCDNLQQRQTLTYPSLLLLESSGDYFLFLWDNGNPLLFNSVPQHAPYAELAQEVYQNYQEQLLTETIYQELEQDGEILQTALGTIYPGQLSARDMLVSKEQNDGIVLLMLSPKTAFLRQLYASRLFVVLLSLSGCLLLCFFAYIFTGRLLKPLQENQEKQIAFVANVSHELRSPLTVMLSSLDARPPRYEATIRQEILRMSRLIDNMLQLSRLESQERGSSVSGAFPFHPLFPDTFLLDFYEQTENEVHAKQLQYLLKLPEEKIPQLSGNEDLLRQLLSILLQNAISYTPAGGTVTLSLSVETKYVCFQVIDTGTGIPDKDKEKVFERFYRVDNAHHKKEHFGLGLCIAAELVSLQKGSIRITDTPGGGCTFTCRLPLNRPQEPV